MKRSSFLAPVVALALPLAACSSSSGSQGITPEGSSSAAGRVAGFPAGGGSAIAYAGSSTYGAYQLDIEIYNEAASCASNAANQSVANETVLGLNFNIEPAGLGYTAQPPRPGSYGVGIGYVASAGFGASDKACNRVNLYSSLGTGLARTGTITLTSFDGSLAVGSYEVTFESGDTLSGMFSAPVCAPTSSGSSSGGAAPAPTCLAAE